MVRRFGVSATTLSAALSALVRESIIVTRPGAGTFRASRTPRAVSGDTSWQESALSLRDGLAEAASLRRFDAEALFATLAHPGPDVVDLNSGYLHESLQPLQTLSAALSRTARASGAWRRAPNGGLPELRDWFADDIGTLSRADVLITTGGQAALATILRALAQPGETVVLDALTYPGTVAAAKVAGLRPVCVPADAEGMRADALEETLTATGARLVVLQPLFSNPTAVSVSSRRAGQLKTVARRHSAFIVEDDFARYLTHADAPRPSAPLIVDDVDGTVVHIRSLTKVTSPNLRIAAVAARGPVMARLQAAFAIETMLVPAVLQLTALDVVTSVRWRRDRRQLGQELAARRAAAQEKVRSSLGPEALESQALGGYHLWVRLPQDVFAGTFASAALSNGVAVTPGGNYSLTTAPSSHVRMSYVAAASTADVLEGVERTARTLDVLK